MLRTVDMDTFRQGGGGGGGGGGDVIWRMGTQQDKMAVQP